MPNEYRPHKCKQYSQAPYLGHLQYGRPNLQVVACFWSSQQRAAHARTFAHEWNKPSLGSNLQLERDMTNMLDFTRRTFALDDIILQQYISFPHAFSICPLRPSSPPAPCSYSYSCSYYSYYSCYSGNLWCSCYSGPLSYSGYTCYSQRNFSQRSVYTEKLYTQQALTQSTAKFTQRSSCTQKFFHAASFYTDAQVFTHGKLLHTASFCTQKLLHAASFHTEKPLYREASTQRKPFPHRSLQLCLRLCVSSSPSSSSCSSSSCSSDFSSSSSILFYLLLLSPAST